MSVPSTIFPTPGTATIGIDEVILTFRETNTESLTAAGDVAIGTIPEGVPLPKSPVAVGFISDVTGGTNFGTLRVYNTGTISINFNSSADLKGHFLEGTVNWHY